MKQLDDFTASEIINYIANKLVADYDGMTKTLAKKLIVNAISYNVVIEAIREQVDYLLEYDK